VLTLLFTTSEAFSDMATTFYRAFAATILDCRRGSAAPGCRPADVKTPTINRHPFDLAAAYELGNTRILALPGDPLRASGTSLPLPWRGT